ncbi:MAG: DNA-3-methyladenine glycosylase family protein [Planctomycetota bacterium]
MTVAPPEVAPLTPTTLSSAVAQLAARDRDLAAVIARHGPPPLWARRPGFATLVRIILEQQVSLASGAAAYGRLRRAVGRRVTPRAVHGCSPARLHRAGITRQKTRYCCALAAAVCDGTLDLAALAHASPETVRERLTRLPGIGPWTADIYTLMALRHPDVWPAGDLALVTALGEVKRRSSADPDAIAARWRPWRAVAARVLWHHYLCARRGRT